jgi:neutral ceramidase
MQVGTAAVDITPPIGSFVMGQFEDRFAQVVNDPLHARAMVLDDGETTVALVACDLAVLATDTVATIRSLVAAQSGLRPDHVMVTATHTHTGPAMIAGLARPADAEYVALVARDVAGVVAAASRAKRPAAIGVGSGWEPSASHNRRWVMSDGTSRTHPRKDDPNNRYPEGPDDPLVGVVFARGEDERLIAALVNYNTHTIVVGHENAYSADYPGYVVRAIKAAHGTDTEVLFVNGALGNVCPIDVFDLAHREYGYRWAQRVGHVIAGEALRVIAKTDVDPDARIRVGSRRIELAMRDVTAGQREQARRLLALPEGQLPPGVDNPRAALVERTFARETLLVDEERRRSPTVAAEVQVIAVGDAAFVGIPAELFVEYGLEIRRRSPFGQTFIAGLANGYTSYVPTPRAMKGGGYEPRLARTSKLVAEAGQQLTDAAVSVLQELRR